MTTELVLALDPGIIKDGPSIQGCLTFPASAYRGKKMHYLATLKNSHKKLAETTIIKATQK